MRKAQHKQTNGLIERRFKVATINHENDSNVINVSCLEGNLPHPPATRATLTLCHGRVFQVNTGLIQTRAAQETPSKSSATLQQEGRRASTPIKNLQGYEATSMAVTQAPLRC